MSFILDALKKSENERHRQHGPALLEVRVAAPRSRMPLWAALLGIALLANAAVLTWLLLRPPPQGQTAAVAVASGTAAAVPAVSATPPVAAPLPATPQPAYAATAASAGFLPDPALATTPLPAAASDTAAPSNPADYLPAAAARTAPAAIANAAADMGLPSIHDLNASGANLPELRLSLHVYDPEPARRYVLLNSTRLREGESTPDGIRLERVTEAGVILAWRNRRFTLSRGE
jgi:general secretion pathway protein B